jgi:hypothetical protein
VLVVMQDLDKGSIAAPETFLAEWIWSGAVEYGPILASLAGIKPTQYILAGTKAGAAMARPEISAPSTAGLFMVN